MACTCGCHTDTDEGECVCTPECIRGEPNLDDLDKHIEGRVLYDPEDPRRRLRYEAGWDICQATLTILREYALDCESEFFMGGHDEDLPQVRALIADFEALEKRVDKGEENEELTRLQEWLHRVANLVPYLWD